MRITLNWLGERLGYAPSLYIESRPNGVRRNSSSLGPFSRSFGLPIKSDQPTRAPIPSLIGSCSPSAIGRLVIAVIVNALNAVFWRRTWPHVLDKIFKSPPSRTNLYAASAVIFETGIPVASASCVEKAPNSVFCRSGQSVCNRSLPPDAPATDAIPIPKPLSAVHNSFPAIASANPLSTALLRPFGMQPQNGETSKSFARYILKA